MKFMILRSCPGGRYKEGEVGEALFPESDQWQGKYHCLLKLEPASDGSVRNYYFFWDEVQVQASSPKMVEVATLLESHLRAPERLQFLRHRSSMFNWLDCSLPKRADLDVNEIIELVFRLMMRRLDSPRPEVPEETGPPAKTLAKKKVLSKSGKRRT
jgi:hypothetical protein